MSHIFQINLSDGGVPKRGAPLAQVTRLGIAGDRQAHPNIHGGPERAVCLYALEHILALQGEGHPIFPGAVGENLTLAGVDWSQIRPGVHLRLGQRVLLEITRYTTPCNTIEPFFQAGEYSRIGQNQHPGWSRVYARVVEEGEIRVGDRVEIAEI